MEGRVPWRTEVLPCGKIGDIFGIAYIPKTGAKRHPLAVFAHELRRTHASGTGYAEALASRGIAVYTFDFRNGSSESRSGNDMSRMSVMTEVRDLEDVLRTAKSWSFADPERTVLIGASQGGFVSAAYAARHPDALAALVLLYPAFLIGEDAHAGFRSKESIPETYDFRGWFTAGRQYALDVWDYDIYREMGAYAGPVLILHGDSDPVVDSSWSGRAAAVYPDAEYRLLRGAGHGFRGERLKEAVSLILGFLDRTGVSAR